MDELTLLRRTRSEAALPAEVMDRGRARLFEHIAKPDAAHGEASSQPRRRLARRAVVGGAFAAGAIALTLGLVITDVVGLAGWRGGAEPAAAAVLEQAGAAAIRSVDPVLAPGQYLRITTRAVSTTDGNVGDLVASYQTLMEDTLYRPADLSDEWVRQRAPGAVYRTFGADSERVAAAWSQAGADARGRTSTIERAAAGAFYGAPSLVGEDALNGLPRDPYRLLNHIYRVTLGTGPSPDTEALVFIADRLRSGVVPAELRAAMYEAAALIPGVEFVDGQVTLDGRVGVAIGRDEDVWGARMEIIIDPETGEFIGERTVSLRDQDGIPAGTTLEWTAVTTQVVASAPEDAGSTSAPEK